MGKFLTIALIIILSVGCQSTPYHSTGSKGAQMSFYEPQGGDGLYEIYQSVRTLFIIITSFFFFVDVGVVIYQLVTTGSAKKGLLGLFALLIVLDAILLIFK
jgi:hypothetical protein